MSVMDRTPTRDFTLYGSHNDDPFEWLLKVRETDPFWSQPHPYGGADGAWVITRYDHVREVHQDYRTFTHTDSITTTNNQPLMPSAFDPPYQTKLRSIVLPLMTPKRIDPLEPRMHAVCRDLIAGFKDRGWCDGIGEFARRYPIVVFCELFGLPEERREEFRILAETWMHNVPERANAWSAIRAIVRSELEKRREQPSEDMLGGIASGLIDGEPIDLDSATNLASTVFLGGLDTLPSNIGWTLRYLADHPEQRRQIIEDPSSLPGAVEEFFRRFPAVSMNPSKATRDIDFHGAKIKAGDQIMSVIFLANCDSEVFDDPLTLDFSRQSNKHLAFAAGSHRCLGSHLARHELRVGLEEWHAAIPDYRVADRDEITYYPGVAGMHRLRLEWDV